VVLLALVVLGSPQHYRDDFHSANEASRIYAAQAIAEHGTLSLNPVFDRYFPGWQKRERHGPPNVDVAVRDGRYLLDKAPGVSLLAVPVIAVLRAAGIELRYRQLVWLLVLWLAALPSALFLLVLLRWLRQSFGDHDPAVLVAPALVLATPWLIYSAQLFGHALAAALGGMGLLLALGPLNVTETEEDPTARRDGLLGGLCLGGAVLAEYPCAVLALGACLAVALDGRRRRRLVWLVVGGLGPAVVLLVWNSLAFGGPLQFSYGFKANPALAATHGQGLYGISLPSFDAVWGLLFSARRGLFFLAPWLVGGIVGGFWVCRDRRIALAWRVLLPLALVGAPLLIAGFGDWHGGRGLGPRYLLFTLPVYGVGAAILVHRLSALRWGGLLLAPLGGLVLSSLLHNLAGHLGFPHVSERIANPLFDVVLPVLLTGGPGPTAWDALLPAPVGAVVLVATCAWLVVVMVMGVIPRRPAGVESAADPPPGAGRRPGVIAVALLVGAAVLHLALGTLPTADTPRSKRRVLKERAFAHQLLGQTEHARRIRRALHR